jgi:Mg2+ and Co2+ transporter CorA
MDEEGTLRRIERRLGEPTMGFLALLVLTSVLVPPVFKLDPHLERIVIDVYWLLYAGFAAEYLVKLALAPSKLDFVRRPARLVDLLILGLPLASVGRPALHLLRIVPALRLLRFRDPGLPRDGGGEMQGHEAWRRQADTEKTPLTISVLRASKPDESRRVGWDDFKSLLAETDDDWFNLAGVEPQDFARISEAIGVPAMLLQSKLLETSFPRLDLFERQMAMFIWYPRIRHNKTTGAVEVERTGTLIIGSDHNLVTLSRGESDPHTPVLKLLPGIEPGAPFLVRVVYALLKHLLRRYEEVIEHLEKDARVLEELPLRESSPAFLERTFLLKREVSAITGNLWRLREMIRAVAAKRVALHGFEPAHQALFEILSEQADYIYETVDNVREGLISLIELHLNLVSFEMNKVMRLLALVTTLALIPTVVGGLLGMNLSGSPWPVHLSQVAFGVGMTMALCLYTFAVKGWLR